MAKDILLIFVQTLGEHAHVYQATATIKATGEAIRNWALPSMP